MIRHFWASELLYAPSDPGQDPRHVGSLEPLWNLFDLIPEGRPSDWDEQIVYSCCGPGAQRWSFGDPRRSRCDNGGLTETNVERARRGFEAALRGDLDGIRELLDADVKWHGGDPTAPDACHNRDQALEFMRRARSRRRVGELVDVFEVGDKVVVIIRPPSEEGEQAALSANLTTFRDGKAVEMVHYANLEDALAAAGV